MSNSRRWINLVIGLIVLAAILNIAWSVAHGWWRHPPSTFVSLAFSASVVVLVLTALCVSANLVSIADWFRVRVPPVVHDGVAGDLTYRDGIWRGEKLLWLEGRRTGPDPVLVGIGSGAVGDSVALEARAREFAISSEIPAEQVGVLNGIRPLRTRYGVLIVLEFSLTNSEDVLDVTFRDGEPIEVDIH